MRLIDADVFVANVIQYSKQSTKTIGLALDATPTIDAVPVVRCKDCKWWYKDMYSTDKMKWCYAHARHFPPVYFCAEGEREDNDS